LLLLCAGVWLHAADSLLVATLMPDAATELDGVAWMGWALALYIVGSIVAGAGSGMLAIRFGVRHAMTGSALLFAIGCVISAIAPNIWWVLFGRILQGLGGGAMLALTFVGLEGLFPPKLTGPVMAVISAVWGASAFCGPLIGGIFAHYGEWRWGFGAFAIQAVLVSVLTFRMLPDSGRSQTLRERPPWARLALLTLSIVAIASAGNWTSRIMALMSVVIGVGLLLQFFRSDSASSNRLMPKGAVSPRTVSGSGTLFILLFAAGTIAFTVYGPLLLQLRFGVSPLVGGYFVAFESISWSVAAVLVAQAPEKMEAWMIRSGAAAATVGVIGLIWALPYGPIWSALPFVMGLGAGFGAFWAFVLKRVVASAPTGESEKASSALPTAQLMGYAIGAALTGLIANLSGLSVSTDTATVTRTAAWIFIGFLPVLAAGWLLLPRLTSYLPEPS
jgi:MFS family permease